jgi:flavodoxin I
MSKVAVVYWSGTGNTEAMADAVAKGIQEKGGTADIIGAADFDSAKAAEYDAIAFGCPAMGDEALEEMTFEPMYDAVKGSLGDKKVALFGSYDWHDGEWMDYWKEDAEGAGLNIVATCICKDAPDEAAAQECADLGAALV